MKYEGDQMAAWAASLWRAEVGHRWLERKSRRDAMGDRCQKAQGLSGGGLLLIREVNRLARGGTVGAVQGCPVAAGACVIQFQIC